MAATRRKHRRLKANPELDITAFLNLMIVLVPVLLLGMVFTQVRMIELDFPGMAKGESPGPESFRLEVLLVPSGIRVADSDRGLIDSIPLRDDQQDYEGLSKTLKAIKQRMPDKTDLILRIGPEIDYQTLVATMDAVRAYPEVVAGNVVQAELFPDVSLADAPADIQVGALGPSSAVEVTP